MTTVTKIVLSLIVASIVSPAKLSVAQAISITNGSYEFESLDSTTFSGAGLKNYNVIISRSDNGHESLLISGKSNTCDFDPRDCSAAEAVNIGNKADTTAGGKTTISTGSTAGAASENSEPTALLLLILGLIGLSRLRGRPVD